MNNSPVQNAFLKYRDDRPTDRMGIMLDQQIAIFRLISINFEGSDEGRFASGPHVIYQAASVCCDLAEAIDAELSRLNADWDVPLRSKAEFAQVRQ